MKAVKLKDNFYYTGVFDRDLRIFDIVMYTEYGTTYNSYFLKGSEKSALFETVKDKFFDEFYKDLSTLTDIKKIDYLIVDHTEPDHSGSAAKIIDLNPDITVVGTTAALTFLKNITHRNFKSLAEKDGMTLSLGDKTLRFIAAPFLHWPDTMFTYVEELNTLITCDVFGAHYMGDNVLRSSISHEDDYQKALKYYFECIMGPFKPHVLKAIDKIKGLKIDMICTGHGPVHDIKTADIIEQYAVWAAPKAKPEKKVIVIPYVSAYGYTRSLAEAIKAGAEEAGAEVKLYDMTAHKTDEVLEQIDNADGVLLGTPTIVGDALPPIWQLVTAMSPIIHGGKKGGAFGCYGWSGEGVPNITERLKQLRLKVSDGFRVIFKPDDQKLAEAREYGKKFASEL